MHFNCLFLIHYYDYYYIFIIVLCYFVGELDATITFNSGVRLNHIDPYLPAEYHY